MKQCVILISGRGSNMQAILRAELPLQIAAVISNDPQAPGLEVARAAGVATAAVDHRRFEDRSRFDARLVEEIDAFAPDFVVLAGFMRILGPAFVQHYAGRLVNIHPSLLPAFPGLHTHRRALQTGVRLHGCTVHFVTAEVDHGPIIIQAAVPVMPDDDEHALAARVLEQEHRIYPQALAWLANDAISLTPEGRVSFPHARPRPALISPALDS
jgi:phosphoribosylglycinamide formyltransferase 1